MFLKPLVLVITMLFLVSCQSEPSNSFTLDGSHYTINDKSAEEYLINYNFFLEDIGFGVPVFIVDGNKDVSLLSKKNCLLPM